VPVFGLAASCAPGSLLAYIGLGSGGCEIGSATFSDFSARASFSGGSAIDPSLISVTPTGLGFVFALTTNAGPGELLGIAIGYSASGFQFQGALLSMAGAEAAGDGVVFVVTDLCLEGNFASDPSDCSSPQSLSLITAQNFLGSTGPDSKAFGPISFFDVFTDITIDGGLSGSALLGAPDAPGTVTNEFQAAAVPEPATVLLVGAGLIALWVRRRLTRPTNPVTGSEGEDPC